ncbi:MAG: TPM domain-containing protein [Desulfarculales bacterium]|jgi:uncharacterized membrane protein YgcG|nr:TPM domain-containing protein [Desulfarculales bacterium]
MRLIIVLVLFFASAGPSLAGEDETPTGPGDPGKTGFVLDRAGLLSDAEEISGICRELYCRAGIEMWLVTVPSLGESGPAGNEKETALLPSGSHFAGIKEHARAWLEELSRERPGRGILLFVVRDISRLDIESGLLLNLPPAQMEAITQRIMVPLLRQGNYQEGIRRGMTALAHLAAGQEGIELSFGNAETAPGAKRFTRTPLEARHLWVLILPAVIYLLARWRKKQGRKKPEP